MKEEEPIDTPCPECGEKEMVKYPIANGPDDWTMCYECKACGEIWD